MNVLNLANVGLAGFLVSLMVLEGLRPLIGGNWPVQDEGLQFERRLAPWVLALVAGPALLWDQTAVYRKRQAGHAADLVLLALILAVWSACYGGSLAYAVELIAARAS